MPVNSSVTAMQRSRFWKLIAALGGAAVIASVGITGCQDRPLPVDPVAAEIPPPSFTRDPTEEEYEEMPPEFRQATDIISTWVDAGFLGGRAYGQAGMEYLANYGRITLLLTLLKDNREITKTTGFEELASPLPWTRQLSASASVGVNGECGHTANANALFFARNQFFLKSGWLEWGQRSTSNDATRSQPSCSCADTSLDEAAYDPYSSEGSEKECDSSDTGSGGSGIQFKPGDYTGGETVDWNTGVGNGGVSACGADAVVEYVCIDTWNETTQSWELWGCGYVTMC